MARHDFYLVHTSLILVRGHLLTHRSLCCPTWALYTPPISIVFKVIVTPCQRAKDLGCLILGDWTDFMTRMSALVSLQQQRRLFGLFCESGFPGGLSGTVTLRNSYRLLSPEICCCGFGQRRGIITVPHHPLNRNYGVVPRNAVKLVVLFT
jgi:hypothetical protein